MSAPGPEEPKRNSGWLKNILANVPLTIWILVGGQVFAFAFWLIKLDDRIDAMSKQIASMEGRLATMDVRDTRAGSIIAERVNALDRAVAWLISNATGVAPLPHLPPTPMSPPPTTAPAPPP